MAERFSPLDATARDELRQIARDAYARGDLTEAIDVQHKVLACDDPSVDDSQFMGLLLFAIRDLRGGIAVLRECLARFPNEAALRENLGVFLLASGDLPSAVIAAPSLPALHCEITVTLGLPASARSAAGAASAATEPANRLRRLILDIVSIPVGDRS